LRRTGATVNHAAFVIDLPDLGGADRLRAEHVEIHSLMEFAGH
jgi:adenine phosphoribosyltransferase